jgi:hypothetical protein
LLDACDCGALEARRGVGVRSVLYFGAVDGLVPNVWAVLGLFWSRVLKLALGCSDVYRH